MAKYIEQRIATVLENVWDLEVENKWLVYCLIFFWANAMVIKQSWILQQMKFGGFLREFRSAISGQLWETLRAIVLGKEVFTIELVKF